MHVNLYPGLAALRAPPHFGSDSILAPSSPSELSAGGWAGPGKGYREGEGTSREVAYFNVYISKFIRVYFELSWSAYMNGVYSVTATLPPSLPSLEYSR